jgi:hypothetical protein
VRLPILGELLVTFTEGIHPQGEILHVLEHIFGRRRSGISPAGKIVSVRDIATKFESCLPSGDVSGFRVRRFSACWRRATRWRVNLVAKALRESNQINDEISRALGCDSASSFSQAFTRHIAGRLARVAKAFTCQTWSNDCLSRMLLTQIYRPNLPNAQRLEQSDDPSHRYELPAVRLKVFD